MVTKSESRSGRSKKKVAAKPLKADRAQPVNGNSASPSNHDVLRRLYASMLKCRMMAEQAQRLLGDRRAIKYYEFAIGHEAVVVGATLELGPGDTIAASPRNFAAQIAKGTPLKYLLSPEARTIGHQTPDVAAGCSQGSTLSFNPFNLGTGLALAHRLEKKRNVVVALSAEDSSTPDRWHEAMKFAGIHKLPIIYVLQRGSVFDLEPAKRNPALDDLSFVARDCGFPAIIVDSNDAVAVWRVAQESVHRARNGAGPTLIECETQLSYASDPLAQMEHYMKKRGAWDEAWRQSAVEQIEADIKGAAEGNGTTA